MGRWEEWKRLDQPGTQPAGASWLCLGPGKCYVALSKRSCQPPDRFTHFCIYLFNPVSPLCLGRPQVSSTLHSGAAGRNLTTTPGPAARLLPVTDARLTEQRFARCDVGLWLEETQQCQPGRRWSPHKAVLGRVEPALTLDVKGLQSGAFFSFFLFFFCHHLFYE